MSLESAKAFVDRMKSDEEFRNKVNECKDTEARKAFVIKQGFDFTIDDLKAVSTELSDEDLSQVQGGGGNPLCFFLIFLPH